MQWRKSSYSEGQASTCVELASLSHRIGVRDSKNPDGGHLAVSRPVIARLLDEVKRGQHDL